LFRHLYYILLYFIGNAIRLNKFLLDEHVILKQALLCGFKTLFIMI